MTSSFEYVSFTAFGVERGADLLARAFADYFVKLSFTTDRLLQMVRADSVDLAASRVALRSGVAIGGALIARRGWTSRLAAMALLPEARRQGAGRALVTRALEEAHARGERTMMLEVIEQNEPAVKLYEACGFQKIRRLVGFSGSGEGDSRATDVLREMDLRAVGAAITAQAPGDLPWQLSGETVAQLGPPHLGYHLDGAWIALSDPNEPTVAIRAVMAERLTSDLVRAGALLRAVIARHPGKTWTMPAIWPEEFSAAFDAAKLPRTALSQWQMKRELG